MTAGEPAARSRMESSGNWGGALPLVVRTRSQLEVGADYCFDRRVSTEVASTNVRGAASLGAKRTSRGGGTPTLVGATEQHARTIFVRPDARAALVTASISSPNGRRAAHGHSPRRRRPRLGWGVGAVAAPHVPLDQGERRADLRPPQDATTPAVPPRSRRTVISRDCESATRAPPLSRRADPDRRSSEPVPWSARHAVVAARGPSRGCHTPMILRGPANCHESDRRHLHRSARCARGSALAWARKPARGRWGRRGCRGPRLRHLTPGRGCFCVRRGRNLLRGVAPGRTLT